MVKNSARPVKRKSKSTVIAVFLACGYCLALMSDSLLHQLEHLAQSTCATMESVHEHDVCHVSPNVLCDNEAHVHHAHESCEMCDAFVNKLENSKKIANAVYTCISVPYEFFLDEEKLHISDIQCKSPRAPPELVNNNPVCTA